MTKTKNYLQANTNANPSTRFSLQELKLKVTLRSYNLQTLLEVLIHHTLKEKVLIFVLITSSEHFVQENKLRIYESLSNINFPRTITPFNRPHDNTIFQERGCTSNENAYIF